MTGKGSEIFEKVKQETAAVVRVAKQSVGNLSKELRDQLLLSTTPNQIQNNATTKKSDDNSNTIANE